MSYSMEEDCVGYKGLVSRLPGSVHAVSASQYKQLLQTENPAAQEPYHQCVISSYNNSLIMFFLSWKSEFGRLQKMRFSMFWTKPVCLHLSLIVLLFFNLDLVAGKNLNLADRTFLDKLTQEFGNNNTLNENQLQKILFSLRTRETSNETASVNNFLNYCNRSSDMWKTNKFCLEKQITIAASGKAGRTSTSLTSVGKSRDYRDFIPEGLLESVNQKCLNASDILDLYNVSGEAAINSDDLHGLTTALLYQSHNKECVDAVPETPHHKTLPTSSESWGYGILFVTIINICALGGAILFPFMKTTIYKQVLMFMVGLAVGSLAGSGLLFLIPEAFHLVQDESHSDYIWKATTIFGGIYLFFLIERFLKFIMGWKKQKKLSKARIPTSASSDSVATNDDYGICSVRVRTPSTTLENAKMKGLNPDVHIEGPAICSTGSEDSPSLSRENSTLTDISTLPDKQPAVNKVQMNGDSRQEEGECILTKSERKKFREKNEIATVAWMIIFGDGLHNFIDGLSIGAAFTESILTGVSVSVAVICEELPHELGDFAILLNSGMSLKKALLFNFLSACMCYLGLIIGILLGQNTTAHDWVFAIAGGMFLYISLVDMLPEMNSAAEEEEKRTGETCSLHVFVIQNAGILIGYSLLLLMAVFGHMISFE